MLRWIKRLQKKHRILAEKIETKYKILNNSHFESRKRTKDKFFTTVETKKGIYYFYSYNDKKSDALFNAGLKWPERFEEFTKFDVRVQFKNVEETQDFIYFHVFNNNSSYSFNDNSKNLLEYSGNDAFKEVCEKALSISKVPFEIANSWGGRRCPVAVIYAPHDLFGVINSFWNASKELGYKIRAGQEFSHMVDCVELPNAKHISLNKDGGRIKVQYLGKNKNV